MSRKSREDRAEASAQERAEIEAIQQSFKLSKDTFLNNLMAVRSGQKPNLTAGYQGGRDQFRDRDPFNAANPKGPNPEHIDWENGFLAKLGYAPQQRPSQTPQGSALAAFASQYGGNGQNRVSLAVADRMTSRAIESFGPVVRELSNYKFASDDQERYEQIEYVAAAVRNALRGLAKKEVASNTQQVYKNLVKYTYNDESVTATFKVGECHVAVRAEGQFTGKEVICLEQEGTDVTAEVVRQMGDQFPVVTQEYSVNLEVIR